MSRKHKIVIIDPSPIVGVGLSHVLKNDLHFEVIGCFADFQTFEKAIRYSESDIVILFNPTLIGMYKQFDVKSLFSNFQNTTIIAIVYQWIDSEILLNFDGTLDMFDDESVLIRKLLRFINSSRDNQAGNNSENVDLSDREKEILIAIAKGMTNKEIADKHFISVHTVVSHRKNITRKTGIKTVSGLTIYAVLNNLVSQEELS